MALDQIRTISVERLLGKITTVDPVAHWQSFR